MGNKKVLNAKTTCVDGISFKSKLEARVYQILKASGLPFSYEVESIVLLEGFYPTRPFYKKTAKKGLFRLMEDATKVRAITYTPDFIVWSKSGLKCFVETKGFKTDSYNIKVKLFRKWLEKEGNSMFAEIKTLRELNELIDMLNDVQKDETSCL